MGTRDRTTNSEQLEFVIDWCTVTGKLHLHEKLDFESRAPRCRRSTMGTNGRIGQSPNKQMPSC